MTFDDKNAFITEHMPYIIKVVADFTHKYVEIENSEELSIALEAFSLAMDKFEEDRGNFFVFAKKVITNKLIDETRKGSKVISLQWEDAEVGSYQNFEEDSVLKMELQLYETYLGEYGICFEALLECAPKHTKTRETLLIIGKKIGQDEDLTKMVVEKKKLPITEVANRMNVSQKVVKSHKNMILAIFIAYYKNITPILQWIEKS